MARRVHRASNVSQVNQTITYSAYLAFNARGDIRLSRGMPALGPGEASCALTLTAPLKLFQKPAIKATVVIPESASAADASADILLDLKNALRACPGVELQIGSKKKNGARA